MKKPLLDYIWNAVDQWLEPIGIGKTEFAALAIITITVCVSTGVLPPAVGDWLRENWKELVTIGIGAGMLGVRHAIRKGK